MKTVKNALASLLLTLLLVAPSFAVSATDRAYQAGIKYYNAGEKRKAIIALTESIALDPNADNAYDYRSICWTDLGDYQRGRLDAIQCIRINPRTQLGYFELGRALFGLGRYADAATAYTVHLRQCGAEDLAVTCSNRGQSYQKLGNLAAAKADYEEALRHNPNPTTRAHVQQGLAEIALIQ